MSIKKKSVLFFCAFPNIERGFTGANIGNKVTYDILKDDLDISFIDLGISSFNPYDFGWKYLKYNFIIAFHFFQKWFQLWKIVRENRFDFLYFLPASSFKGHFRDVFTIFLVRGKVGEIVVHNRNGNFDLIGNRNWHSFLTKYMVNNVNKFIFLSEELKKKCKFFIPDNKCFVVFNPIDEDLVCKENEVIEKILSKKKRKILKLLFLSNMISSKGYMDVLKMASILHNYKGFSDFRVDFIGRWNSAIDEAAAQKFVIDENIQNFVTFHGKITNRKIVKSYLLGADVFILPTYYPVEAQPRSIIEALNCGTPVISTFHASIPEIIDIGKDGILVEKNDPESLAQSVLELVNYSHWKLFAFNSRKKYNEYFSVLAVKSKLNKVFH